MQDEANILDQFFATRLLKNDYSEKRAKALIRLMQASRKGNLCYRPEEEIDLPDTIVGLKDKPIVFDRGRYYLSKNWEIESLVIQHLLRLYSQKKEGRTSVYLDVGLLSSQKEAINRALSSNFLIIYGGPGTGKTFTASHLVRAFCSQTQKRVKVILTAPTGKAASHLTAVLGDIDADIETSTLHRILKIKEGENPLFSIKTLDADLVIVDEASMMDGLLFAKLFSSIGNHTTLVLMGDPDQLPPIQGGSLFSEMAHLFGVRLEKSMRAENRDLLELADEINRGEFSFQKLLIDWDFDQHLAKRLKEKIKPQISDEMPDPLSALKSFDMFRVLGGLRQGPFGIDKLNQKIVQEMELEIKPGQWWVIPVMITVNEPKLDLYNGTSGVLIGKSVKGIDFHNSYAYFPEKIAYAFLPPFEVAFCLSVHKSQGSEFQKVLAIFAEGSENFGREALYTAVTRAKKSVEIMVEEKTLRAMLSQRSQKESGFTERIFAELSESSVT